MTLEPAHRTHAPCKQGCKPRIQRPVRVFRQYLLVKMQRGDIPTTIGCAPEFYGQARRRASPNIPVRADSIRGKAYEFRELLPRYGADNLFDSSKCKQRFKGSQRIG